MHLDLFCLLTLPWLPLLPRLTEFVWLPWLLMVPVISWFWWLIWLPSYQYYNGYLCYCYQGCWLAWLPVSATCVLVVYVFCLCHLSISTYIDIKGKWLTQGLVYTQALDGPIYSVQFSEKCLFRMYLSFCSVIR